MEGFSRFLLSHRLRNTKNSSSSHPQFRYLSVPLVGVCSTLGRRWVETVVPAPLRQNYAPEEEKALRFNTPDKAVARLYRSFVVSPDEAKMRLDRFIQLKSKAPMSLVHRLLRTKEIDVTPEGQTGPERRRWEIGDRLDVGKRVWVPQSVWKRTSFAEIKQAKLLLGEPEDIQKLVVYKDDDIIAINKPSGLPTQGGSKITGLYVAGMLGHLKYDYPEPPRLLHRLDKDTSGLLLLARNRQSAIALQQEFKSHIRVKKKYYAFVNGNPLKHNDPDMNILGVSKVVKHKPSGKIQAHLVEGKYGIEVWPNPSAKTQLSITDYKVVEEPSKEGTLLELNPLTGRKHQLRVICSKVFQTPIFGDTKYGKKKEGKYQGDSLASLNGTKTLLHLHAAEITLLHPTKKKSITITAPLPAHFRKTLANFSFNLKALEKKKET